MFSAKESFVAIPRELDANTKFFIWDFDVVVLFMTGVILGIFVGSLLLGGLLGAIFVFWWNKVRQGQARGFGIHSLYWHLPMNPFKRLPASFRRDFQG